MNRTTSKLLKTMKSSPPITLLPPELLRRILDKLVPDPGRTVPIDDRRFLSVESFDEPPPSDADWDLRNFRSTCRRFAEVGDPLLFTVVAVRFSKHGLRKLEELASWPKMARHVKKFTYMVPYYYPNGRVPRPRELSTSADVLQLRNYCLRCR